MKLNVKQSKKKYLKLDYLIPLFLFIVLIIIIINPAKYSAVAFKGLEVWVKVLVPSLFPFFVLTKLFSASGFMNDFSSLFSKPTKIAYNCPPCSSYIFFMSIITGYPVGAKLVADMYHEGKLKKTQAVKTMSFCSNSGPMFILGSVGIGMFNNKALGIIVLISHILGSLLNGLIYRRIKDDDNKKIFTNISFKKVSFSESITSSISSIMLIGGVVCFSFVLIEVISSTFLFNGLVNVISSAGINSNVISAFLCGLGEITKGSLMFSSIPLTFNSTALILTFTISFGGISTLLQALAFVKGIVETKMLILQKLTHAICATIVCACLLIII